MKRLPEITELQVKEGFCKAGMEVFTDSAKLIKRLFREEDPGTVLLMMSSGNYDGIDLKDFSMQWVTL